MRLPMGLHQRRIHVVLYLAIGYLSLRLFFHSRKPQPAPESAPPQNHIFPITIRTIDPNVVQCTELFHQNPRHMNEVYKLMRSSLFQDLQLKTQIHSCDDLISKRGYPKMAKTNEERDFPIAFTIMLYKDFYQFEKLLHAIYQPQNIYCVHVDLKVDSKFFQTIAALTDCFPNVHLSSRRVSVIWGHFSVLEADLVCMDDLLRKDTKWKYLINLTGQEFPLKTNWELVKILKIFGGASDVHSYSEAGSAHYKKRLQYKHIVVNGTTLVETTKPKGPMPKGYTFMKGRIHITASRDFIDFALNDRAALRYLKWIKDVRIPDETYFPVLFHNRHLGAPGADGRKVNGSYIGSPDAISRLKLFRSATYNCHGKYVRDICIFGIEDLEALHRLGVQGPYLFVNKIMSNYQPAVLECMCEMHWNRSSQPVQNLRFNRAMFEQLDNVQHYRQKYEPIS